MVAIAGFSREQILRAVRDMYHAVATTPLRQFHFPTGRDACLFVGYPQEWLDQLPSAAVESFAGVGFPFRAGVIQRGDRVLDLGAGSGTDALIAARLVGPEGQVFALDMTPAMLSKLKRNIAAEGVTNVHVIEGNAEAIPLADASVDVVTSNGVLNLVPEKPKAFAELLRVLRPGGRAQLADIVVSRPAGKAARRDPKLWAECVVGAALEDDYLDLIRSAGFEDVSVLRRFDYFSASSSADTRRFAGVLGARAAEITMRRPEAKRSAAAARLRRLSPLALGRRMAQYGLLGSMAAAASIIACYGVVAVVGVLGLLGMAVKLDSALWVGFIVTFLALALLGLALNALAHRRIDPLLVGAGGALLVCYALLGSYDWRLEAAGFAFVLGAVFWDRRLYRAAVGC
ncbi:MAG: methyltransferase domain-containing protein [Kiloniellaceae bacterium]|nr:methyltransferase domain-containing protein [Kiloniellaceae bacterium]